MSTDGTEFGSTTDPFVALRASAGPEWTDPIAPDPDFAARLRDLLERGATLPTGVVMSTTTVEDPTAPTNPTAPVVERPGALPYLTVRDARAAVDWYVAHLGARLRGEPILMDDNTIGHAELEIGDGVLYLAEEFPDMGLQAPGPGHVSVSLMLPVPSADAALANARGGGAIVTREPYEAHGTRSATIIDPFGHRWMLTGPVLATTVVPEPLRPGDIAYLSLQTPDVEKAARFYGAVLGWEYDPSRRQVTNLGHRLGISAASDYGVNTLFCVYAVDDFVAAHAAVVAAGGRAGEVSTAGDGVRVLDAVDDQGVAFSMYIPQANDQRMQQNPSGHGEMSYLTVHTPDSSRLRSFYGSVLGWSFTPGRIDDGWEVDGAHPQIGIAGGADSSVAEPMWNVSDIDAAVARVRDAGGRVLREPDRQAYGITAHCVDDQGARFYLGQLF
ncbi:VOC family protein [Gordonia sp. NPDC003504]